MKGLQKKKKKSVPEKLTEKQHVRKYFVQRKIKEVWVNFTIKEEKH